MWSRSHKRKQKKGTASEFSAMNTGYQETLKYEGKWLSTGISTTKLLAESEGEKKGREL